VRALHPELAAAKRAIAHAPAGKKQKLRALDAQARRIAPLPIPNGEKTAALIEAAEANGLCGTQWEREDVEHVIRERFAGRSAGVGYVAAATPSGTGAPSMKRHHRSSAAL
jgi:hypothetical protein